MNEKWNGDKTKEESWQIFMTDVMMGFCAKEGQGLCGFFVCWILCFKSQTDNFILTFQRGALG